MKSSGNGGRDGGGVIGRSYFYGRRSAKKTEVEKRTEGRTLSSTNTRGGQKKKKDSYLTIQVDGNCRRGCGKGRNPQKPKNRKHNAKS